MFLVLGEEAVVLAGASSGKGPSGSKRDEEETEDIAEEETALDDGISLEMGSLCEEASEDTSLETIDSLEMTSLEDDGSLEEMDSSEEWLLTEE